MVIRKQAPHLRAPTSPSDQTRPSWAVEREAIHLLLRWECRGCSTDRPIDVLPRRVAQDHGVACMLQTPHNPEHQLRWQTYPTLSVQADPARRTEDHASLQNSLALQRILRHAPLALQSDDPVAGSELPKFRFVLGIDHGDLSVSLEKKRMRGTRSPQTQSPGQEHLRAQSGRPSPCSPSIHQCMLASQIKLGPVGLMQYGTLEIPPHWSWSTRSQPKWQLAIRRDSLVYQTHIRIKPMCKHTIFLPRRCCKRIKHCKYCSPVRIPTVARGMADRRT